MCRCILASWRTVSVFTELSTSLKIVLLLFLPFYWRLVQSFNTVVLSFSQVDLSLAKLSFFFFSALLIVLICVKEFTPKDSQSTSEIFTSTELNIDLMRRIKEDGVERRDWKLDLLSLRCAGVTFPSGEMQQRLVRSLYQEASISPEQVEYIEAHGTGTKVCAY